VDITYDLNSLKQIDIRTVSGESLKDINDVVIDTKLPAEKRAAEFVKQIGNPYCFRVGKMIVQMEYNSTGQSINDCLKEYLECQA